MHNTYFKIYNIKISDLKKKCPNVSIKERLYNYTLTLDMKKYHLLEK